MASDTSDLFDRWFRIADQDRDGRISGQEAVTFYQRSGLNQETLFKIWKLVADDNSHLTKAQFWASLGLVSLAQRRNGMLPDAEARSALIGVGPALPPPVMLGLETEGATNSEPVRDTRIATAARAAVTDQFPTLHDQALQNYLQIFKRLDADGDGRVQGGDCFGTFIQSGLPKQVLKDVWQVVAGDGSFLTQQQFVSSLYLMDLAKQGRPVPPSIPTKSFPPVARTTEPAAGTIPRFNLGSVQQTQHDVFSNDLPTPNLPRRAVYTANSAASPQSKAPALDSQRLDRLDPLQRQRLENDAERAYRSEQELIKAQREAKESSAKEAYYREALQELTLFKSRTSASLLQAQEQLQSAKRDAEEMEVTYQTAWTTAQANHSKNSALLEELSTAKARKAESRRKLDDLEKDINALDSISGDQVKAERDAAAVLLQEVARLEAEKAQLVQQKEVVFSSREVLQEKVSQLRQEVESATVSIDQAEDQLVDLVKELEAGDDSAAVQLQACLRKISALQQRLVAHAKRENITIPEAEEDEEEGNSQQSAADAFMWSQYILVGAKDWQDGTPDQGKGAGMEIVDDLPDDDRLLDPNARPPQSTTPGTQPELAQKRLNGHAAVHEIAAPGPGESWAAF